MITTTMCVVMTMITMQGMMTRMHVRNAAVESESDSDDDSKPTKVKRRRTVDKTQTKRTPTNAVSKKTKKVAHWL
jgi:hypothetical protein